LAELTTREMLEQEAEAIHGLSFSGVKDLYRSLNEADSAALCLSGGGIRSAAFALGVIQALATHPRSATGAPVATAEHSLLASFHYLSTVSGGGYIGAWLSAWRNRVDFATLWANLIGRPGGPDNEPPALSWLRDNSNYLTPKLGVFSADVWASAALYVRNLLLNWLVILPVICVVLVGLKLFAVLVGWLWRFDDSACPLFVGIALAAALMLIISLRFRTRNRPTRNTAHADQAGFLRQDLVWAILAATGFAAVLVSTCAEIWLRGTPQAAQVSLEWLGADPTWARTSPRLALAVMGAVAGATIYALSWVTAWPKTRGAGDFALWTISGLVFGALVGVGVHLFLSVEDVEVEKLFFGLSAPSERVLIAIIFGVSWVLIAQLIAEVIFVGLTSYQDGSDGDREWLGRAAGWLLVTAIAWLVLMFLVFVGSEIAPQLPKYLKSTLGPVGGVSGILTLLLGKSAFSSGISGVKGLIPLSINIILGIAAPIFAGALVILISALLDKLLLGTSLLQSNLMGSNAFCVNPDDPPRLLIRPLCVDIYAQRKDELLLLLAGLVIIILIGWITSRSVNINRFSLHSLYRNRLIRAFLGATNQPRNPDPFTGFDVDDNLRMHQLWPAKDPVTGEWPRRAKADWRPFHLVNMTLNIVSTRKLAWQERRAEPFTASPMHSGSSCKAYRPSLRYGDQLGISLGTAMAISGAAASPNMGYHSSSGVSLLMALFNVRLGWWLGNPGKEGETTYFRDAPRTAVVPFIQEMFGLTTDDRKYVYLSDGGHFENLGLYEMVRRRCRFIVVTDAGCDPTFALEDLGNAVRKIELDLGVSIRFDGLDRLKRRPEDGSELGPGHPYHAIGRIDYPSSDGGGAHGTIIYVKAGYHGTEGAGVRSYAMAHRDFPHETTGDQWFSESQFESYRRLGFEIMDDILGTPSMTSETIQTWRLTASSDALNSPPAVK
jgi:hypothetical protein